MERQYHRPAQQQQQQQCGSGDATNTTRAAGAGSDSGGGGDDADDEPCGVALRNLRVQQHASENQGDELLWRHDAPRESGIVEHPVAAVAHIALEQEEEQEQSTAVFGALAAGVSKSSLSFILDDEELGDNQNPPFSQSPAPSSVVSDSDYEHSRSESGQEVKSDAGGSAPSAAASAARRAKQGEPKRKARRPPSRVCKFEGCEQYVVDQGLCVRHGGGKRCQTEGCTSRAKHQGRCWRHGGSTECKIPSCINRAKSRGYCWSHGGGTKCKLDGCGKIAISNGLCWAHGGGKRCIVRGCMRQAYERTNSFCNNHFQELESGTFAGEIADEDADEAMDGSTVATLPQLQQEEAEEVKREW
ncbi:hypothetical protein PybrP1_010151 [[Pythium] brassicae (nom. inval.)]|nr:hypothetical protein PybrP1_010151 [[Pythium] brassicae (nom. inval.)]